MFSYPNLKEKGRFALPFLSYVFAVILTCLTYTTTSSVGPIVIGLLELAFIILSVNMLFRINVILANVIKGILLLCYNIQMGVLLFSGTYTSLIMLSNLHSLKALSGNAGVYIFALILVLLFSFLPTKHYALNGRYQCIAVFSVAVLEMTLANKTQLSFSPAYSWYGVAVEAHVQAQIQERIKHLPNYTKNFYQSEVKNAEEKPKNLPQKPNIVLIFTEGLSQHIIDDARNIMPNVARVQKQSLNFTNYFNHTFATYRGLQGQLFSGYQLVDQDKNNLSSIQSVLRKQGYKTSFINSEPKNQVFTSYLNNLGFNEVITSKQLNGAADTVSDKDLYEILFEKIEKESQKNDPFFISTYSFGTHISLDSPDNKYGDQKNDLLNRFYNLDKQFGKFIKQFNASKLSENTILVFTTDHATFVDAEYRQTFANQARNHGMVDEIPLFFYYKGIEAKSVDAKGKNSLNLVPTILDYADISAPNYFLGSSLFDNSTDNFFATKFVSEARKFSTEDLVDGSALKSLTSEEDQQLNSEIEKYYAAKIQIPLGDK